MAGILDSALAFIMSSNTSIRVAVTLLILVLGHLTVKSFNMIYNRLWILRNDESTKKDLERKRQRLQYISYILDGLVITGALFYLNSSMTDQIITETATYIPDILTGFLVAILGVITINIFARFIEDFLKTVGVRNYFREAGLSVNAFKIVSTLIKGFLYLILLQIVLGQLGIAQSTINELVTASSWAVAFLIAGLVFYGFKDLFKNFAAGVYLKNSRIVRPGEEVKMDDETGEIKEVSLFSTTVDTNSGFTVLAPNSQIMDSNLKFKRTRSDLDTLEEITSYFVAQDPSFCGPASMEMALEIFGYRHDQKEIGEKANVEEGEGADEHVLMDSVEELTNNEVKTAWIGYDDITELDEEFKAWFNDGALIVPNFYKPEIFPDATAGHFVLSVGVEGDEILILDPSGTNGGVYYVNKDQLKEAMAEFGHKRGYIVVAPKGTTAHWRIKNDLIYADKSAYDELSKTLEARLRKILRQGRILKNSTPSSMEDYMEKWGASEKLTRIWMPEQSKQGEDKDETTENN
ncbi:mechanosensitive ion channel domain-containing protein [Candidatus Nanohalovita haloferacivicina]|uniref:mechanosensitive ion channel domain-containing protein n=1 Tax=Candidatus Nanohalovita haloferacivicina TaxID=2978046 RepID=UPI00325F9B3C|nr:Small conductance mechanosensitive channel [Candidatus Nanohalobia archaeon BNXNv]